MLYISHFCVVIYAKNVDVDGKLIINCRFCIPLPTSRINANICVKASENPFQGVSRKTVLFLDSDVPVPQFAFSSRLALLSDRVFI